MAPTFVPPVSIVLAARPGQYVQGLVDFREGGVADWIGSLAGAMRDAAAASVYLAREGSLPSSTNGEHERGSRVPDQQQRKLIDVVPSLPVLSAPTARVAIGVSQQQTLAGLKTLAQAGVITQLSEGTYRQYGALELFDLIAEYEQRVVRRSPGPSISMSPRFARSWL